MTQDMIDFAKPIINKKPDAIVLHVGTNDITNNIADIKSNISTIIQTIKSQSPNTNILLSNIILREDDVRLKKKRDILNKAIENLARETGSTLIDNGFFDSKCIEEKFTSKHIHRDTKICEKHQKAFE